jgi:hypothetical protein
MRVSVMAVRRMLLRAGSRLPGVPLACPGDRTEACPPRRSGAGVQHGQRVTVRRREGRIKPASQTPARGPDKGILVASSGLGQSQFRFEPPNRRAGTPDVSAELVRIVSGVSAERLLPSLQLAPGFQELGLDNRGRAVVAGCHQGRT